MSPRTRTVDRMKIVDKCLKLPCILPRRITIQLTQNYKVRFPVPAMQLIADSTVSLGLLNDYHAMHHCSGFLRSIITYY